MLIELRLRISGLRWFCPCPRKSDQSLKENLYFQCLVQLWYLHASISQDISWPPECLTLERFRRPSSQGKPGTAILDDCSILPYSVYQNVYFYTTSDVIQEISMLFFCPSILVIAPSFYLIGFSHWIQARKTIFISVPSLIEASDSLWKCTRSCFYNLMIWTSVVSWKEGRHYKIL